MLRPDLPDNVKVTTQDKLNGSAQLGIIARTGDYIVYRPNQLALVLIDIDDEGYACRSEGRDQRDRRLPTCTRIDAA